MKWWQSVALWLLRLTIGGLFAMSGFVKMVDLWGFVFKIEEYLSVWNMTQPRTIVLVVAMLISGYEFVLGTLLAMGCYKRSAPLGLTLSMVVMLPLTAYLWIADPVSDCGCFGEFLKLSNWETFAKNIFISCGLVCLLKWNYRLRESLFNPAIQWMVGALISLYILTIGLYGYNAQPMLDFRPFPVGSRLLPDGMETGENDEEYGFVYEKDGHRETFGLDNLPDSTWTFVDRIEPSGSGRQGHVFAFFEGDENVTDLALTGVGTELILVVPEPIRADMSYSFTVNEIAEYADSVGIPMIALLGASAEGVERWKDRSMAEYPCYTTEDTVLKELSRGTMSIVELTDGVITSKTTVSSMNPDVIESPASVDEFLGEIEGHGGSWFSLINVVSGGALLAIYLFQGLILAIRLKIKRHYRKKTVEN